MAKTQNAPKSFESAITELETIVQEMESGTISLELALDRYQRGMALLKHCQETLQAAEQRVHQLENGLVVPISPIQDKRAQE